MPAQRPPKPPYIDWRLDAWKIGAIVLFFFLLFVWVFWEDAPFTGAWRAPAESIDPRADVHGDEPIFNGMIQNGVVVNGASNDVAAGNAITESASANRVITDSTAEDENAASGLAISPTPFGAGVLTPAVTTVPETPVSPSSSPSPTLTPTPTALPLIENSETQPDEPVLPGLVTPDNNDEDEPVVVEENSLEDGEVHDEVRNETNDAENDAVDGELNDEINGNDAETAVEQANDTDTDLENGLTPAATPDVEQEALEDEPDVSTPEVTVPEATAPENDVPPADVPPADAPDGDVPDGDALELPLTLSNVAPNSIAPLGTVTRLEGTGSIGRQVEVRVQHVNVAGAPGLLPVSEPEQVVGSTDVDEVGRWRLTPDPPLRPGQNVISLRQLDETGALEAVSSPVVVNVLSGGEEGPLSLVTPAIRFPEVGSRLEAGTVAFRGSGLPGIQVRLYLNNRLVGETFAGTREEWQISLGDGIRPGAYVARAAAVNPQGEIIAESAPVAFVVHEATLGLREAPPGRPAVPLDVARVIPAQVFGPAIFLNGTATPHSSVAVLLDGAPLIIANVQVDERWALALDVFSHEAMPAFLTVATDLGEQVLVNLDIRDGSVAGTLNTPVIVLPVADKAVAQNPPVVAGLAKPGSRIVIGIGGEIGAQLTVDALGQWAYRPRAPLAPGEHIISVAALSSRGMPIESPGTSIRVTVD